MEELLRRLAEMVVKDFHGGLLKRQEVRIWIGAVIALTLGASKAFADERVTGVGSDALEMFVAALLLAGAQLLAALSHKRGRDASRSLVPAMPHATHVQSITKEVLLTIDERATHKANNVVQPLQTKYDLARRDLDELERVVAAINAGNAQRDTAIAVLQTEMRSTFESMAGIKSWLVRVEGKLDTALLGR